MKPALSKEDLEDDLEKMSDDELLLLYDNLWDEISEGYRPIASRLLEVERELTLRHG